MSRKPGSTPRPGAGEPPEIGRTTNPTPAQRLGASLSGHPLPVQRDVRDRNALDAAGFVPLDPATLEHLDYLPPTAAELDQIVNAAAEAAREQLKPKPPVARIIDLRKFGIVAALVAIAMMLGLAPGATSSAQAATAAMGPGINLRAGAHHSVSGTLHAGAWILGGRQAYCVSYNQAAPDGTLGKGTAALVMPGSEATARAALIVNTWGTTANAHQAAQVWFALAELIAAQPSGQPTAAGRAQATALAADLPGYIRQVSTPDVTGSDRMLTASKTHAPYRVTVTGLGAVPGQTGTLTVKVLGANGSPASARPVTVAGTGIRAESMPIGTNSAGVAQVAYMATGLTQSAAVTVTSPSSTAVLINRPGKGRQTVLGGGYTDTTKAVAAATLCPVTLQVVTRCACGKGAARRAYIFTADVAGNYRVQLTDSTGRSLATAPLTSGQVTLSLPASAHGVHAGYTALTTAGAPAFTYLFDPNVTA